MKDGRRVTQNKIWNTMTKQDKRATTSNAQPINRDGSRASKEQVQQRRWEK